MGAWWSCIWYYRWQALDTLACLGKASPCPLVILHRQATPASLKFGSSCAPVQKLRTPEGSRARRWPLLQVMSSLSVALAAWLACAVCNPCPCACAGCPDPTTPEGETL